jgi:hypothetical protein
MIKTDIKAYKVVIDNHGARATLICVTYKISQSGPHYGAEFYVLVSSFDDSNFTIPHGSHTFTFKEELRMFWNAVAIAPANRNNIEGWLTDKMKDAYGDNSKITVSDFTNQ